MRNDDLTNSSELHQFKRTTSIQANYINSSDLYINSNDLHQFRRLHQFAWTCMCTKWLVYLLKQVIGNSLKDFSLITKVSEIHFKNFFGEGKALWRPKIFRYLGKTSSILSCFTALSVLKQHMEKKQTFYKYLASNGFKPLKNVSSIMF